jgi:hypothetical protein
MFVFNNIVFLEAMFYLIEWKENIHRKWFNTIKEKKN